MKEKDQEKLAEFIASADFSSDLFKDIATELVSKHKHESLRQHTIRAIIEIWTRKYPMEVRAFKKEMQKFRETRSNKFAATDKAHDQRHIFKFPSTLWNRLTSHVSKPEFLSMDKEPTKDQQNEWSWVIAEFPMFVVPEKI